MYSLKTTIKYIIDKSRSAEKIIVFGALETGIEILKLLKNEGINITCFCDNNVNLQGKFIKNVPVIAPKLAVQQHLGALYIVASTNYRELIVSELLKLHIPESKIICYYKEKSYEEHKQMDRKYYRYEIEDMYYRRIGKTLNLDVPKTYNEKINYQKIYNYDEKFSRLTDKYTVRKWVEKKIGKTYLNELFGYWGNAEQIDFNQLPNQFVLKLNHGCGWNIIVRDKSKLNIKRAKEQLENWKKLNFAYYSLEMQYESIKPLILCEKYLENSNGDLYDYKVFCFHGEPKYIMFLSERNTNQLKMAFYNTNWEKQPFVYSYPMLRKEVEKPAMLDKILELSKILSSEFEHVRVDWYILPGNKIRFGEMTFTSAGGFAAWDPPIYDEIFGALI